MVWSMGTTRLVASMYAAMDEISGAVMYPADVAMDCMALFSSKVSSLPKFSLLMTLKKAKARITDVMPMPNVQPVLMPTYRFVRLKTPPRIIPVNAERHVNCGMLPLYTFSNHQKSFSSRVIVRICVSVSCFSATFAPFQPYVVGHRSHAACRKDAPLYRPLSLDTVLSGVTTLSR